MSLFVPLIALRAGVRVGQTLISTDVASPTVVDAQFHEGELNHALRTGDVIVQGEATDAATGFVVYDGCVVTPTGPRLLQVDVSAGHLQNRAEIGEGGEKVEVKAAAKLALKPHSDTEDRTSLVRVKESDGSVSVEDGVLAAPGKSVAPAAGTGYLPLATVLVPRKAKEVDASSIVDVRPLP